MRAEQRRGISGFDGRRLEAARAARGLAARELAAQAGVTVTVLEQYARGERSPERGTVERLATALDCSADDLRTAATTTLRDLRERAGASQEEAAAAASLKRSAYAMLEQGRTRTLPAQVAQDLAAHFGVDQGAVVTAHAEAVARRGADAPARLVLEGRLLQRLAAHFDMSADDLLDLAQRLSADEGGGRR
ncbi:helix-turn-helix domain-containing protein [Kitasatospora sp. NPDC004240]